MIAGLVASAAFAVMAAAAPAVPAPSPAVEALPADAKVAGHGYAELAEAWWRWAYRRRDGMRPYQDPTGAECAVGQTGDVWFLAGTAGTGAVERRCAVPEHRHVFVPVLAVLETSAPGKRRDCKALRAAVGAEAARPVTVRVELDGVPLAPVRSAARDCFDAYADAEEDDPPPGMYAPAATDGLWLLLPPLPAGEHRLVVEAKQAATGLLPGRHDQRFAYVLEVGGASGESDSDDQEADSEPERRTL